MCLSGTAAMTTLWKMKQIFVREYLTDHILKI